MKFFNTKILSAVLASALMILSSSVYAKAAGEDKVTAATENTVAKIEEAISMAEKGSDAKAIADTINEARQIQKEWRYEVTERQRERANTKLRLARDAFTKGEKEEGLATLKEALASYKEMKVIYDSKH
jgi:large subunit ribosomal protein L7/L12